MSRRSRLAERTDAADAEYSRKRAFRSGSWATAQQVTTIGASAVSGIILARNLLLNEFGIYSYATTLASMGMVIMTAGLSTLAIKVLVNDPQSQRKTMTALIVTREGLAVVAYLGLLTLSFTSASSVAVSATAVALLVLLSRAFDATEYWFQSRLNSKRTAVVRVGCALLMLAVRLVFVAAGAGLTIFLILYVVESLLISVGLLVRYWRDHDSPRLGKVELQTPARLFKRSWLLMLAGVAAQVNTRGDILVMQAVLGGASVGVYSAAARMSEVFYFLPVVFMTATFPRLMNIRNKHGEVSEAYQREMQRSYDLSCWTGIAIGLLVWLFGPTVLTLTYGVRFAAAGPVLQIHVLALPFVFMGAVFSKWLVAEDLLGASLARHTFGAILNISLNILLIPKIGIIGAAYATLISYIAASYVSAFATRSTRSAGLKMSKAMVWPARYLYHAASRIGANTT